MAKTIWELGLKDMVSAGLAKLDSSMSRTYAKMAMYENQLDKSVSKTTATIENQSNVWNKFTGLVGGYFAVNGLMNFSQSVYDTGTQLETLNNVINYTSKDAADAAANHDFLKRIIDQYKLPLLETTDGFSQMNAALMGSKLAGQAARDVFEGVSIGATAMHLSAAQTNQVFTALNQMVSKGTVQAQELKLQLGNALPGAFQLAAKAMNMTTAEFTKQMEEGKILADDFLPKFAAAMKDKFAGAIPAAIQSTIAKATELKNKSFELKNELFEMWQPIINKVFDLGIVWLPKLNAALHAVWDTGKAFGKWIDDHAAMLTIVAGAVGGLAVAYGWMNTVMFFSTGIYTGLTIAEKAQFTWMLLLEWATNKLTWAQKMLHMTMLTGPWGWALAAVGALIGAFVYFWNTSEKFRASIFGIGAAFKQVFSNIVGFFKTILAPVFEAIQYAMNGEWGKAAAAGLKAVATLNPVGIAVQAVKYAKDGGFTKGVGEAYDKGYKERITYETDKKVKADPHYGEEVSTGGSFNPLDYGNKELKPQPTESSSSKSTSGSGGHSGARSITVTIDKLIEKLEISTTNLGSSDSMIKEAVTRILVGAVRDAEISLSRS